ncbi:MAG: anti-sigma factor family protein [Gaiella sp.]
MRESRTAACDRARMWAALVLDGELSSFERRLLEVHLTRCASCREHAERFSAITITIRETDGEMLTSPIVVRGRRRQWGATGGRVAVAGTAMVALVAVGLGFGTRLGDRPAPAGPEAPLIIAPVLTASDSLDTFRSGQATRTLQAHRTGLASPQISP